MASEGFSFLWRRISPNTRHDQLYETLKMIYRRLQVGEDPGVILPETVNNMSRIIESTEHPAHVKCVVCHVLKRLCYNEALASLLVRRGLLKCLNTLIAAWTEHTDPVSQTDSCLIDSQLAILETLSHHHKNFFTDFMDLNMLKTLSQLSGPQCQATFRFGNHSRDTFRALTAGVYPGLIGNVKSVHEDLRWETYLEYFGEEYALLNLPVNVLLVELYDTSDPKKDVNIATEMRARKASWPAMEDVVPMMQKDKNQAQNDGESEWKDMYVTSIVDGCRFWAQLGGSESFHIVKEIDGILRDWPQRTGLVTQPAVGLMIGVRDEQLGFIRAQVTSVNGDIAEVHVTDYGCRRSVCWWKNQDVFLIDTEMELNKYPPQATLCILQDVSPPPMNTPAIIGVAAIIRNLSAAAGTSYVLFAEVSVIRSLQYLVACPDPAIVRAAAQAISNMAHYLPLRIKLCLQKTLYVLMDKLEEYAPSLDDELTAKAAYSILGALTNLLFEYSDSCQQFVDRNGLPQIVSLLNAGPDRIRLAARRLLAVFIGNAVPVMVIDTLKNRRNFPISTVALGQLRDGMTALGLDHRGGEVRGRSRDQRPGPAPTTRQRSYQISEPLSVSQTSVNSRRSASRERRRSRSRGRDSSNSSCERRARAISKERLEEADSESDEDLLSSLVGKKRAKSGGETSDGEILAELAKPFSGDNESAVLGLDTASVYRKFSSQVAYVRGRTVAFTNDVYHDIRPFEKITKVSRSQILSAVCGLLNAGTEEGGSIFFGILKTGSVVGMVVDRSQRDTLRTSIDALMMKLTPTVTCSNYSVEYHQVVDHKPGGTEFKPVKDLVVVEIKVRPTMDQVYMLASEEMYVRDGDTTEEMTMQMLHKRTVEEAERKKLSKIETLEKELSIWTGRVT